MIKYWIKRFANDCPCFFGFGIGILICGFVLAAIDGCSTAATSTYQGVATTQVAGQTALDAWNRAIPIVHPSTNTQYKVRSAFNKWKSGMIVVCDAGAAYSAGASTTNAPALEAALEYAIASSAQDKTDFLNLLSQAGVNISTNSIP